MYARFSEVYDKLTQDIDYVKWADYLESAFLKFGIKPSLVLELGCGTGSLALEMSQRGFEMIGLDRSADMLSKAYEKMNDKGLDILFLNQDMRFFELYGTVDVILCMLDSINYILSIRDLRRVFKLVRNYLNPGGLFIFDTNTAYKLSEVLPSQTFFDLGEEVSWIWNSTYEADQKLSNFDITFFVKNQEGLYERFEECHQERAYSKKEITNLLELCGLKTEGVFGELSFEPPAETENRIFYIARKPMFSALPRNDIMNDNK